MFLYTDGDDTSSFITFNNRKIAHYTKSDEATRPAIKLREVKFSKKTSSFFHEISVLPNMIGYRKTRGNREKRESQH